MSWVRAPLVPPNLEPLERGVLNLEITGRIHHTRVVGENCRSGSSDGNKLLKTCFLRCFSGVAEGDRAPHAARIYEVPPGPISDQASEAYICYYEFMNSFSKKIVLVVAALLLCAALLVLSLFIKSDTPEGMRQIKSYRPGAICQSISPDCGRCPGEVIHDKCYVKQDTFDAYQ